MRPLRLLLVPAGAALGIAAEQTLYGWASPADWLPDLAAGWTLMACGLVVWPDRVGGRTGKLMTATGFLWFAGNFATVSPTWLAWISEHAQYAYRGPLVQMVLTFPRGRAGGRLDRGAVAVAYIAAVVTPVWRNETTTIVLAGSLALVAGRSWVRTTGRARRATQYFPRAPRSSSPSCLRGSDVRLVLPTRSAQDATLLAHQTGLCTLALVMLAGLLGARAGRHRGDGPDGRPRPGSIGNAPARSGDHAR